MLVSLTLPEIITLAADSRTFIRGRNMFEERRVGDFETPDEHSDDGVEVLQCAVTDAGRQYTVKLFVSANSRVLLGHNCRCTQHLMWKGACDHVVAALCAAIRAEARHSSIGGKIAAELVENFERFWLDELDSELAVHASAVSIYPQIHAGDKEHAYLTLTVGASKRYVVKNIEEFLNNVEAGSTVSYGKDLTFNHNIQSFDEASAKLIRIFSGQLSGIKELSSILPSYFDEIPLKKAIPLPSGLTDEFFDALSGRRVELCRYNRLPQSLEVTLDAPGIRFDIGFEDGYPVITGERTSLTPLKGKKFDYLLGGGYVHRVPKGYVKAVVPLLDGINRTKDFKIVFPQEKLHSFCGVVLPQLQKWGLTEPDVAIPEGIAAAELKTRLYFSMDGMQVVCEAKFCYGDISINPLAGADTQGISRNELGEHRVKKRLAAYGFYADYDRAAYALDSDEKIFALLIAGLAELNSFCEVYGTDEFTRKTYLPPAAKASVGVRLRANLMELTFDASGYSVADLIEALESYRAKKSFHRLRDGRFINLRDDGIEDAAGLLDSFELSKRDYKDNVLLLPRFRAMYLDSILSARKNLTGNADDAFKSLTGSFREPGGVYNVPAELDTVLRPYQKVGFEWLKMLAEYQFGGILADDMGLGKTIQIIALVLSELEANTGGVAKPSLVVAPTSLVYNWQKEFLRFAPRVKTVILTGLPSRRKELLESSPGTHVFITTYDTLKRDVDNYKNIEFKYVIADEAQYMKNAATQNAAAVKQISSEARFALTGTPIENGLSELWSVFDFIMPGYLYTSAKFSKLFETPIIKNGDEGKSEALRRQIAPFLLRRLKKDVLTELPEKVETNLFAEMEPEQKRIYAAHLLKARGELDGHVSQIEVLAQLTRLRQICCHPRLFSGEYTGGSGKLELAMETVQSATESGHRILLFSQFTSMLAIILGELDMRGIDYFYLDGKTPPSERVEMAERFNSGERSVFAISLKAGGTGLNLVGADVVIHYDPWWNPAVMNQASDRAHRYGQDKAVQVINIVTKDSIEEKILELQERKRNLVDSVITEGGSFIDRLSQQELLALFGES